MIADQLKSDQLAAMKSGDRTALDVLRYIVSQIKYREIEKQSPLTDDEVVAAIRKQLKEMQESLEAAQKANRPEMIEEQTTKIALALKYLPEEMSDDELQKSIQKLRDDYKDDIQKNPKAFIGICMKELKSKVDPARIRTTLGM